MTPINTRPTILDRIYAQADKVRDFAEIYRIYRVSHGRLYAARIAYNCAFNGSPF